MDYAFAPGASRPEGYLRNLFKRRTPATTLVHRRNLSTVHGFIDHLASSSSITLPIGNILLGSHANSQGLLKLKLFPNQKKVTGKELTDYETLEATLGIRLVLSTFPQPSRRTSFTSGAAISGRPHPS